MPIVKASARLDDLAPKKIGLKIYLHELVDGKYDYYLDLADPKGKALEECKELIDKTGKKLIKDINKKISK